MPQLNENSIEQNMIDLLVEKGFKYVYGPDIAPSSMTSQREDFSVVVLKGKLIEAIDRLNPKASVSAKVEALKKVMTLGRGDLMENNEMFHTMLTEGVRVQQMIDGEDRGVEIQLVDFENQANNEFIVCNQFTIVENHKEKRPDIIIFVNGLPLIVVELKNAIDENATLKKAHTQIQNYKTAIPTLFHYNAMVVLSDGLEARTSSVSAPWSRMLAWKSPIKEENGKVPELQLMLQYMFEKDVLLKLIRYCTVFESEKKEDPETGVISTQKIKKIATYHQYYAVQKAVKETIRSTAENGDKKAGVIWHTQGSGKSLSMVFYAGQLVTQPEMKNPTIVVLTDRNDLDDQLFSTFGNCSALLRQTPVQAKNRDHLKTLLAVSGGGIIFTTIQKFYPDNGSNVFDELSSRKNIVVVADEAHRSQYGFNAREIAEKNEDGIEIGSRIVYGNAKYMRDAIPNASFIGFTGTPIEKTDKSTPAVFGDYIDIYDIQQAVLDGATVPIHYESRLVKIKIKEDAIGQIDALVEEVDGHDSETTEKAKRKWARVEAIIGHPERVRDIAKDVITHFEARQESFLGKAMLVAMSRRIAVDLYAEIIKLRPEWYSTDLTKGAVKVIMTSGSSDPESWQQHNTSKQDRQLLAARFKEPSDELKLVIVRDMWLTGFDAPSLHTLYLDKKMQGANLMQAIARVNRVYGDKPGGLIVDYIGIASDLKKALNTYTQSGGEGRPTIDISEAISQMRAKFEIVEQMYHDFDYQKYFTANTQEKLQTLLNAQNLILATNDLKNRFIREVTLLSQLFALCTPSIASNKIKDEVAFFQAIKARIIKFTPGEGGKSSAEIETAIRQIMDEALTSEGVMDIFALSGVEKPELSILSEEFLIEVQGMEQKNVAMELLKKILSDELRVRHEQNLAQSKRFSEMLKKIVQRYQNNLITTAEVIQELADMARDMRLEDNKAEELGLSTEEYAFYCALGQSESAMDVLGDDKLRDLSLFLVEKIKGNISVDWEKREDVRAKLRLLVKKALKHYGYPPDLEQIAIDRVLDQSTALAKLWS